MYQELDRTPGTRTRKRWRGSRLPPSRPGASLPRMSFFQEPPRLGNQYEDDALLRSYLDRALPKDMRAGL